MVSKSSSPMVSRASPLAPQGVLLPLTMLDTYYHYQRRPFSFLFFSPSACLDYDKTSRAAM